MKKTFDDETKRSMAEDFRNGVPVRELEKKYKTSYKNRIVPILKECGIDPKNPLFRNNDKGVALYSFYSVKENNELLASQFKYRTEFAERYQAAYRYARDHGWLKEYDEKYFTEGFNYRGFSDPIHLVYVYEVKETHSAYVGRTINLKTRDHAHRIEKENKSDSLYWHCKEHGIEMPEPIVLVEGLTARESQKAEGDYVEKYKAEGWNIINRAPTGENKSSLGSRPTLWTYDSCKEAAALCKNKAEYKKKYCSAFNVATANKWLYEFFPDEKPKPNHILDTLEGCIEAAKPYVNIMDIRKNYPFLYQRISRNKWTEQVRQVLIAIHGEVKKPMGRPKTKCETVNPLLSDDLVNREKYVKCMGYLDEIQNFLMEHGFKSEKYTVCGSKDSLSLYITKKKVIVQLICLKWATEWFGKKNHTFYADQIDECEKNGNSLIQIYEDEYAKSKEMVLNKILHSIGYDGGDMKKINGRDCEVREIYKYVSDEFLDKFHVQGSTKGTVYLGAYHGEDLVAVMVFRDGSFSSTGWELVRFASDYGCICRGVGGKLFKHFTETYEPDSVVSFADRRWTNDKDDNVYTKIGFSLESTTPCEFKYYYDGEECPFGEPETRLHKMYLSKGKISKKCGFDPRMTETEMAKELGYDRIWDCGLFKYVWTK